MLKFQYYDGDNLANESTLYDAEVMNEKIILFFLNFLVQSGWVPANVQDALLDTADVLETVRTKSHENVPYAT